MNKYGILNHISKYASHHSRIGNIAIIGAGIGGLATAIALKNKGFHNVTVYEKDRLFEERRQGYGLTILQGKSALRSLGVLEKVKEHNSYSKAHYIFDEGGKILGFYGPIFWDHRTNGRSTRSIQKGLSMHIPRQALRKILLDRWMQLNGTIKWDHSIKTIQTTSKHVSVCFKDKESTKQQADLLVGADGIYSKVRQLTVLHETAPLKQMGVLVILGLSGSKHHLTQNRIFQTTNGSTRLYTMPFDKSNPEMNVMWQLSFPFTAGKKLSRMQYKQLAVEMVGSWHQPISSIVEGTSPDNVMGVVACDRDPVLPEVCDRRVVLIGDASHPMSPFKGQGANQALLDAVSLAQHLSQPQSTEQNVTVFSDKMMKRVAQKVIKSRNRAEQYHCPSYKQIDTFLYPGVSHSFIQLLHQQGIGYSTPNIQEQIGRLLQVKMDDPI